MVGLNTKLALKTSQGLALSPQMLQAVQILQLAKTDLDALIAAECEQNPLLIQADTADRNSQKDQASSDEAMNEELTPDLKVSGAETGDNQNFASVTVNDDGTSINLDIPDEAINPDARPKDRTSGPYRGENESAFIDSICEEKLDLYSHLRHELQLLPMSVEETRLAEALIYCLDPTGYLYETPDVLAMRFGVESWQITDGIDIIQSLSPTGVGARSLAECLRLQLKEKNRLDPLIGKCLDHLPLIASADYKGLKAHGIHLTPEDLSSILSDLRTLDPKPGLQFSHETPSNLSPDLLVRPARDGGWQIQLNPETQPRLLIDQTYQANILRQNGSADIKTYMKGCLQSANGLIKALDGRATTLVRVATEIIKHQADFLDCGLSGLKALNLTMIAEALDLHESTISRAVANKTILTPSGLFALRYFFTHTVGDGADGDAPSVLAIKTEIKVLINQENPAKPLSDEKIVQALAEKHIKLARRTVTKYREAMNIGSSSERRKQKRVESAIADGLNA